MTLALVFRARICWERPLKLPGLLSSCWMLTSSPISLIKTCKHRRQNVFSEAGHHSFERVIGRQRDTSEERHITLWATFNSCLTDWTWLRYSATFSSAAANFSCTAAFSWIFGKGQQWVKLQVAIVKVRTEEKRKCIYYWYRLPLTSDRWLCVLVSTFCPGGASNKAAWSCKQKLHLLHNECMYNIILLLIHLAKHKQRVVMQCKYDLGEG